MSTVNTKSQYRAFGLTIRSEVEFPELQPISGTTGDDAIDVEIVLGDVPHHFPGHEARSVWADVSGDQCLLSFRTIGRFLVSSGNRIVVEPDSNATIGDVRGFILGSAFAAIAHQRGLVPLHVSAVLSPQGAIAFTGESGAGKSTIAAHINHLTGWPLISDDVSALYHGEAEYEIESGVHTVKLWNDALGSLGRTSEGLRRDLTRFDKFHAIDSHNFAAGRYPLKKLVQLNWGDALEVSEQTGTRAFQIALNSVYRPELARLCENRDNVVAAAMKLAASISVLQLTRRQDVAPGPGVLDSIRLLVPGAGL